MQKITSINMRIRSNISPVTSKKGLPGTLRTLEIATIVLIIGDTSYKTEAYHSFSNFINLSNLFYVFGKFIEIS